MHCPDFVYNSEKCKGCMHAFAHENTSSCRLVDAENDCSPCEQVPDHTHLSPGIPEYEIN